MEFYDFKGIREEIAAMSSEQRTRIHDLLVEGLREMKATTSLMKDTTSLLTTTPPPPEMEEDSAVTTTEAVVISVPGDDVASAELDLVTKPFVNNSTDEVVAVPNAPFILGADLDTQLHLDTDEQLCSDAVSDTYLDQDTVAARLVTNDEDLEYLVLDMHLLNTAPPPHQQQEAVAGQALKDGVEEEVMAAIWYTNMLLPFGKENDHKPRYSSSVSPTTCSMEVPNSILCFTTPMPVHNVTKEPDLAFSHDVTAATFGMTSTCSMKCFSLAAPTGWVFLVAEGFTFDPGTVMDVCCNSGWEPWPPPLSVYIIGSDIAIRPAPWPNFIMHIVLVGGFKGSVLLSSIGDFSLFICNEKHLGVLVEISDCFLWKLPCCYVHGENNRSTNFVEFIADQQQSTGMSWFITDIISGAVHPVLQIEVFAVFFDLETLLIGKHAIALLVVMARVNAVAVALLGYFLDNAVFSYLTIVSVTASKRYMLSYRRILSAFMVVCLEIMGSLSFGPHFELDASRRPIPMTISDNSLWSHDANSSYYFFQEFSTRMHAVLVSSCSIFFEAHIILEYITEQRKQLEHGDKLVALGITGCKDVPKLLANRIVQKVSTSMKHSSVRHRQKDNRRGARLWVLANAGLATSELRTVLSSVMDRAVAGSGHAIVESEFLVSLIYCNYFSYQDDLFRLGCSRNGVWLHKSEQETTLHAKCFVKYHNHLMFQWVSNQVPKVFFTQSVKQVKMEQWPPPPTQGIKYGFMDLQRLWDPGRSMSVGCGGYPGSAAVIFGADSFMHKSVAQMHNYKNDFHALLARWKGAGPIVEANIQSVLLMDSFLLLDKMFDSFVAAQTLPGCETWGISLQCLFAACTEDVKIRLIVELHTDAESKFEEIIHTESKFEEIIHTCVIVWLTWTTMMLEYSAGGAIDEAACQVDWRELLVQLTMTVQLFSCSISFGAQMEVEMIVSFKLLVLVEVQCKQESSPPQIEAEMIQEVLHSCWNDTFKLLICPLGGKPDVKGRGMSWTGPLLGRPWARPNEECQSITKRKQARGRGIEPEQNIVFNLLSSSTSPSVFSAVSSLPP